MMLCSCTQRRLWEHGPRCPQDTGTRVATCVNTEGFSSNSSGTLKPNDRCSNLKACSRPRLAPSTSKRSKRFDLLSTSIMAGANATKPPGGRPSSRKKTRRNECHALEMALHPGASKSPLTCCNSFVSIRAMLPVTRTERSNSGGQPGQAPMGIDRHNRDAQTRRHR